MEQMQNAGIIDPKDYVKSRDAGVTSIRKRDGEVMFIIKKFLTEPDADGNPVAAPIRRSITRAVLAAEMDAFKIESAARIAGFEEMLADFDAATIEEEQPAIMKKVKL